MKVQIEFVDKGAHTKSHTSALQRPFAASNSEGYFFFYTFGS